MPRKILVTGGSEPSFHLVEQAADNEYELQDVLLAHPQLIPAEDLGLDDDLLVVGRETTLASGSVDLLCLSRSGELVIVEFKTGPKNPDFRHALAQVIDYGSDLWKLSGWAEFDEGVVHRYLASQHVGEAYATAGDLRGAASRAWQLTEEEWGALTLRLDQVLNQGDFMFVVAAQRFTDPMHESVRYLNEVTRYGRYFLVELVRMDGHGRKAYAAQVVERPATRTSSSGAASRINQTDFLTTLPEGEYREAMGELLTTVHTLGLGVQWYSNGASIRLKSPDRTAPISIGWVFQDGGQWYSAKHVTFGVDPATLANHPSLVPAVEAFVAALGRVPGGQPATGKLKAVVFAPTVLADALPAIVPLLDDLKVAASAAFDKP